LNELEKDAAVRHCHDPVRHDEEDGIGNLNVHHGDTIRLTPQAGKTQRFNAEGKAIK